ncbi:MAG TPA: hypothetical protein DCE78_06180 [Bacteroidetes bacterium]|nr:hypothetical protein [Bacteroidota bacterium]
MKAQPSEKGKEGKSKEGNRRPNTSAESTQSLGEWETKHKCESTQSLGVYRERIGGGTQVV